MDNKKEFDFDMFEGTEREAKSPEQRKKKNEEKKKHQKLVNTVFFCILAVIIIIAVVFTAPLFFAKYNPERYAKQYIEAVIAGDYGNVYDKSEGRSFASFSRDEFIAACKENPQLVSISDGKITDFTVERYGAAEGDFQNMLVTFTTGDGAVGTYIFPMHRINNGFWKYDSYGAVLTFDIVCSARIYVPIGTDVLLDGEVLPDEQCETVEATGANGEGYSYFEYKVSPLLAGTHTVRAENAYCDAYEESVEISKVNADLYIALKLSEAEKAELISAAQHNITAIYSGAAAGTLKAEDLPLTSRFANDGFESLAASLGEELYAGIEYISVTDFEISGIELTQDFEATPELTVLGANKIQLPLTFDYTYKLTNTSYTYSEQTEARSGVGYAIVTYTCSNGKWQLDDIALQAKF